jgi:ubiquinone/menaquinone biosynthesis C-methylase UbiE
MVLDSLELPLASSTKTDLYELAGIGDIAEFYRERFFTGGVHDARYFDSLSRFDIKYARTMWVYDNVRRGSSLLELGCGEGMLALLKRKDVKVVGIDLSSELVAAALHNGYDAACVANVRNLPFPDSSFDYIVSLDVMGHIGLDDKDQVLAEIKRVLRGDGVTMHGIETTAADTRPAYETMDQEQLSRFINIDGHIGLESDEEIDARFGRFFSNVQTEPRYTMSLSRDEFLKQADAYGEPYDKDFIDYLRGLSFTERRAFDMAMGYVFQRVSDLELKLPSSGLYALLKASDRPLGPFYNEHRDRHDLFRPSRSTTDAVSLCLDRSSQADFDGGWVGTNNLPPVARWMGERAAIRFASPKVSKLRLDLTTHVPELETCALSLEFFFNGQRVGALSLFRYGWLELEIDVPENLRQPREQELFQLEIRADRTWQPASYSQSSKDDRRLSIAVCNIEIFH